MPQYLVKKLKLGKSEQLDQLAKNAGELYSRTVVSFWRTVRHKGHWLSAAAMMRWHNHTGLHAHSADAVVQNFYASLKSWRQRRKTDVLAKPPWKRRRFYKITWKSSGIRLKNGLLILSNGKGNQPLVLKWLERKPRLVEIGWDGNQYELRACYALDRPQPIKEGAVAAIDLGEIHLAVAHDGVDTLILNGRYLRSKRRYQNKLKAELASLIDKKKKKSNRWWKLVKSKKKQLAQLTNQIRDILHKQTSWLISTLRDRGVQKIVIGDVRNLRQNVNYGKYANQKIHQMLTGQTRWMLTYKSALLGMEQDLQDEAYTTQECPVCGKRHKPRNRNYRCPCGFQFHRDGVGSINIRRKYLGLGSVVGVMASPTGKRYHPHLQRSSGLSA